MSLFSTDFSSGSRIVPCDDLASAVNAIAPDADFDADFARVMALTEDNIHALAYKYVDVDTYASYGADAPDFPLCLDFAELASADIRKGAILKGLTVRPAFGVLEYTKNAKDANGNNLRHAINWAWLADGRIVYFEPQNEDDGWLAQPQDLRSFDSFYL